MEDFVLFIPCIVDNKFTILNKQNAQNYSLGIYIIVSQLIFLHVSVRKGLSSGNQTKVIQQKNKLVIFVHNQRGVK